MKHHSLNSNALRSGNRAALFTLAVALVALLPPAEAAKAPKPPPSPLDTGTIYYTAMGETYGIWSMNPDGSAKTFLQAWPSPYSTEPSQGRHNGLRWFLTPLDLDGTGESRALCAVAEDGSEAVQVTTPPDEVQLYMPNGSRDYLQPRWATGTDGRVDGRVSYLGMDATGEVSIYAAEIDPDALGVGFEPEPSYPVRADLNSLLAVGDYADYDWSPDGNAIAFVVLGTEMQDGIYVTGATVGSSLFRVTADGAHPRWSPVRADGTSRIAFISGMGSAMTVNSVNPDGTDLKTVIPPLSNPASPNGARNFFGANVRWSPHGSHLIYDVVQFPARSGPGQRYIYQATADGGSPTCLTKTLNSAFPLGWGTEP